MTALTHTIHTYTVKETARAMRAALHAEFPGVKFSVRMSRGTGHGYIDIGYTDGPQEPRVREVADRFRSSYFDGMDDSTRRIEPTLLIDENGQAVEHRWSSRGADPTRHYSDAAIAWAERTMPAEWEQKFHEIHPHYDHDIARRNYLSGIDLTGIDL